MKIRRKNIPDKKNSNAWHVKGTERWPEWLEHN